MRRWLPLLLAVAGLVLPTRAGAFEIVGHRGAQGLAPGNTIPAFLAALHAGVTRIEVDVVTTRDGHVIIRHDRRVDPRVCRGGYAHRLYRTLTLRQVRRLDCGSSAPRDPALAATQQLVPGSHVPTLDQLLRLGRGQRVRYLVEVKRDPTHPHETIGARALVRKVVALVRRYGAVHRTTVQSFDWSVLRRVRRLEPRLRLAALARPSTAAPGSKWLAGAALAPGPFPQDVIPAAAIGGFTVLSVPYAAVTPDVIANAHAADLQLVPYTVDAPDAMRALLRAGVDGLITDYPDRLRRLVSPPPAPSPSG